MQPGDDRPVTAYPTVVPMLAYEDPGAALDWLAKAFGFRERLRLEMPDGRIGHAEMDVGENGVIMLATPSPDYEPPRKHRQTCARAAAWLAVPYVVDGVLVHVANVEEHMARARDAGTTLGSRPPSDTPRTLPGPPRNCDCAIDRVRSAQCGRRHDRTMFPDLHDRGGRLRRRPLGLGGKTGGRLPRRVRHL